MQDQDQNTHPGNTPEHPGTPHPLQAEEALRRYHLLAEHVRDAILCICRDDGRILDANAAALSTYGYSRDELLKLTIHDLRAPGTRDQAAKQMSNVDATGLLFETVHQRKDGSTFPVEVSSRGATIDGRRTLISVIRDITERKRAQEELAHSERQLRRLVEQTPAAIAMFDTQMRYLVASRRWLSDYGLTGQDIIGRSHYDVFPDLPAQWKEVHRRCLAGSVEKNEEERFPRANGRVDWVRWEARPWHRSNGDIGGLILLSEVITERKQALETLAQSREWLRVTLDSIGDAVMTTGMDGRVTFLNPVAAKLTGWPVEQVKGRASREVFDVINEQTGQPADDIIARVLKERRTVELANHTSLRARDGRLIPIEDSAAPILDNDGNILGVVLVFHDVTEKRRVQEAILHREERYRRLVEMSPDAIIVHRQERIEFANPAALRLLGASTPEDILGKTPFQIFDPDYHAVIRERISQLRQGQSAALIEEQLVRLDGSRVDVTVVASAFVDQNGPAIQVIMHDITERKQKEEQRQRLNRTLKALNNSNQALLRAADEATLLERICQIITGDCGYAMVWIGFTENDEHKSVRPIAYAGFEEGYLETLQISSGDNPRGQGPTGTAIRTRVPCICRNMLTDPMFEPWRQEAVRRGYASSLAVPLLANDTAFGAITVYSRDPDPFSEDEVKLLVELAADLAHGIGALRFRTAHEQVQEALRQSEEHLRVAATAADIGVWNWNFQTGEVVVSANWRRLFGVDANVAVSFDTWRAALHPQDLDRAVNALLLAKEQHREYNVEYRVLLPNNEVRWIVDRGRATYGDDGQALNMAGVNVDITDRKRAETALVRSEKLASVGRMAVSIAHEINNPLAAVMNTLFLARTSADLPPAVRQHLELADAELKRIAQITRQALGFYREHSLPAAVSVNNIVDSAVDVLQSKIKAKNATIDRHYDGNLQITAVSGELRQVICNLLANSLDAIGDRGVIRIHAFNSHCGQNGDRYIRLTLADNGKGIDPVSRPHIFEALFTTKDVTGTGLGLWITKQIIERHGGSIRFRSRVTGSRTGTVFSILLPCNTAQPEHLRAHAVALS